MQIPTRTNIFGKPPNASTPAPANYSTAPPPFSVTKKTDQMQALQPIGAAGLSQSNANSNSGNFKGTTGIFPQQNMNQPQASTPNIFNKTGISGTTQNFNYPVNNMNSPAANSGNASNMNFSKNPFSTMTSKTSNSGGLNGVGGTSSPPKTGQQNQNILGTNNIFNRAVNVNSNPNSMSNSQNLNNGTNNFLNKNPGNVNMSSNLSPFFNKPTNNFVSSQFNNNPGTANNFNQNPAQNVFHNQHPNQTQNPFHNFQYNQQVPQGMSEGLPNYVQQGQQQFQNGPNFQHPGFVPNQNQNMSLFPHNSANNYHIFLNNLVNSDNVNRSNNPKELFQLGEGWALGKNEQNSNDNLLRQDYLFGEFLKMFDYNLFPQINEMAIKQQTPIQITNKLFQKLNEPFTCKMILSQLWLRLKEKFDFVVKSVNMSNHHCGSIRIKDLPYHNQMMELRKQIYHLAEKVGQLKEKDNQIKRIQAENNQNYKLMLQKYKQAFCEVNLRAKMMEEASEELEKIQDYVHKSLKPAFRAYVQKQHVSINDPDDFMLDISQYIAKRLNELDQVISDHMVLNSGSEEEVINFFELAENVCRFYEEVAAKLYDIREKMKTLIKIAAKYKSFGGYQDLQRKIEEKTKDIVNQKMAIYNKLKEVEDIIENKKQVSVMGKSSLQGPQKLRRSS